MPLCLPGHVCGAIVVSIPKWNFMDPCLYGMNLFKIKTICMDLWWTSTNPSRSHRHFGYFAARITEHAKLNTYLRLLLLLDKNEKLKSKVWIEIAEICCSITFQLKFAWSQIYIFTSRDDNPHWRNTCELAFLATQFSTLSLICV